MRFTGSGSATKVLTTIGYAKGAQDDDLMGCVAEGIKVLSGCVGAARTVNPNTDATEDAKDQILIGLAIMAIGEANATLLLCSGGLERQARIHVRSLAEYQFRAELVLKDDSLALELYNSENAERIRLAELMQLEVRLLDQIRKLFPLTLDSSGKHITEKRALGGDMRQLIEKHKGGTRDYALEFAYLSQVSHGSVLALKELSDAISGVDESFLQRATRDGMGNIWLLTTANRMGCFIHLLVKRFKIAVDAEADAFITKLDEMITRQGGIVLRPTP